MTKPLIKDIKIRYFRSIYDGDMRGCKPLNITIGSNDAGKSNILRALNLFFNNISDSRVNGYGEEIDYNYPDRDWDIDFSQARIEESKIGKKKKYIEVKITFNRPETYTILPEAFIVTKRWGLNYIDSKTSYSVEKKQERFVNGLLNKIRVNYIPAVKHRGIFSHYLRLMHDVLIDNNPSIKSAFSKLEPTIQTATQDMSAEIQQSLGLKSRITFPTDLSDIFGSLDFLTQSDNSQESVSLLQRGDGIQTRHLPYILDFIAQKDAGRHYIWLYEEPEASLELTQTFDLARSFSEDFSQRNQIFITTHSPAFYSLSGKNITKYQVQKAEKSLKSGVFTVSNIRSFESLKDADDSLGLTKLVSERAKEVYDELRETKRRLKTLRDRQKPLIICEGSTDIQYIRKALELSGRQNILNRCDFIDAGGCDRIKTIIKACDRMPGLCPNGAFCVFDCDVTNSPKPKRTNLRIFHLAKQANTHFTKGIENLLPPTIAQIVESASNGLGPNNFFREEKHQSDLFRITTTKTLDKVMLAEFVCQRNQRDDFALFEPLIGAIENFLLPPA